ncbi:MAG TPA: hypothetical protein ENH87_11230 [Pricia antarctica]|uniref:Bacteriophage tail tape measure N-terminal domain-containing protein n=1 Tax=Pricia antarctica TaxID=641691 RepID=A0A831VN92_9FLAO|nr:hypothetical protein [Pricia antarctica]
MAEKKASLILNLKDNATKKLGAVGKAVNALKKNWLAITAALVGVTAVAIKALKAFGLQEEQENKLTAALKNVKGATEEGAQELIRYAGALEKTTRFGDEEIISAQAMLATFQLNEKQIAAITPRLLDMAEASRKSTGAQVDLQTIAIALGKGFTGQAGQLSRYGVVLDKQAIKTEGFNGILKSLDNNFKGIAEASAQTFIGSIDQLKNTFGTLLEAVGKVLAGPLSKLVPKIKAITEVLIENIRFFKAFIDIIVAVGEIIFTTFTFIFEIFETFRETLSGIIEALIELVDGNFVAAYNKMAEVSGNTVVNLFNDFKKMVKNQAKAFVDLKKKADEREKEEIARRKRELAGAKFDAVENLKLQTDTGKKTLSLRASFLAKLKAVNEQADKDKIAALQATLGAISSLSDSSNKALFLLGKAAAIANAIVSTSLGVSRALGSAPPPLNFALAALVAAAGAVQVSKIGATNLAEGGVVLPRQGGTVARIGEAGKAEAVIPLDDPEAQERLGGVLGGTTVIIQAGVIVASDESLTELAGMIDEKLLELRQNSQAVSF